MSTILLLVVLLTVLYCSLYNTVYCVIMIHCKYNDPLGMVTIQSSSSSQLPCCSLYCSLYYTAYCILSQYTGNAMINTNMNMYVVTHAYSGCNLVGFEFMWVWFAVWLLFKGWLLFHGRFLLKEMQYPSGSSLETY